MKIGRGVILDRSVFSDWVFAEKNRQDKNITEDGYQEYLTMRKMLLAHLPIPQITVYLDVSANECYRRVHHLRGRVNNSNILQTNTFINIINTSPNLTQVNVILIYF